LLAQSPYLRLALSPEIMRGQWATRMLDPARLEAEVATNLDADVLCIESSYLQSSQGRKLLWRYLTGGRGVLLLVNRITPAINGFLREIGFEAEGTVTTANGGGERFQFVFSNHPIFHPFLSADYGNLMDIRVSRYVQLKASQAMPLVFSEKGAGLFFQGTREKGKLFVAAFGLDREHTSWPVHPTFIPFLDLTMQAARAEDATPMTFEPGEAGLIQLPAATKVREVVLHGDEGEVGRAPVEQARAELRMPRRPGLYDLTYDDGSQVEKVFTINPSPKESQLIYVQIPEATTVWRLNGQAQAGAAAPISERGRLTRTGILQQRVWWWMVLAVLLALLLEMALAEWKGRNAAPA